MSRHPILTYCFSVRFCHIAAIKRDLLHKSGTYVTIFRCQLVSFRGQDAESDALLASSAPPRGFQAQLLIQGLNEGLRTSFHYRANNWKSLSPYVEILHL